MVVVAWILFISLMLFVIVGNTVLVNEIKERQNDR